MKLGKCPMCNELKFLTLHSKVGGHRPPFIHVCRACHDILHGIKVKRHSRSKKGSNGKLAKGTVGRKKR